MKVEENAVYGSMDLFLEGKDLFFVDPYGSRHRSLDLDPCSSTLTPKAYSPEYLEGRGSRKFGCRILHSPGPIGGSGPSPDFGFRERLSIASGGT